MDTLRCALVKRSILNDYYLMFFLIIFTTSHLSNQLAIIYWTLIIISLPILAPPLWRNLAIEGLHDDIDFFFILKKDKKIFLCFYRSTAEGASEWALKAWNIFSVFVVLYKNLTFTIVFCYYVIFHEKIDGNGC